MEPTNGKPPELRAELHMTIVVDADRYEPIGKLMDRVAYAVAKEVGVIQREGAVARARFDFTGFNTRPCKAAVMAQLTNEAAYDSEPSRI
jgi:hypothetical protein